MHPIPFSVGLLAALSSALLLAHAACSGAQPVAEAATCSPKADIWHQVELARICGKKLTTECPEAPGLRARYLELEAEECSSKP